MTETKHAEHVTVEAWMRDCIEGECEHVDPDEAGTTDTAVDTCPSTQFVVCVDCMDEKGAGRDEEGWDELPLEAWPHPGSAGWTETPPPAPPILREHPEEG
ncbi:hypothetical protein ACFVR6_03765 [Microbacterium sp. NPDC058021]|uniref:hypothetical protein n=1 Tax=Microbacterium sp. NPDC058021 TaxID=3346306 RepID=UPI0036D793B6